MMAIHRRFVDGASRDRTGDLLLAKWTLGVLIVCRTLPLAANTAFSVTESAHTLPLLAASACSLLSPGVWLARSTAATLIVCAAEDTAEGGVKITSGGVRVFARPEQMDVYVPRRLGAAVAELL
jgi:hypothetical protein